MINYSNLSFKGNKLYCGKKRTGIYLIPVGENQFKVARLVRTEKEELISKDFFNIDRAKDNAKKWFMSLQNTGIKEINDRTDV